MKKKLTILAGVALVAAGGVAVAQTATQAPATQALAPHARAAAPAADMTRAQATQRAQERFGRLDLNRDGRFTPEEAQQGREQRRAERMNAMFDRVDADRNGSITREEMRAAQEARLTARDDDRPRGHRFMRGHGRRGAGGEGMRGGRMFGEQGYITAEQFQTRALERFDRLDADDNGVVTATERQGARHHRRGWRGRGRG